MTSYLLERSTLPPYLKTAINPLLRLTWNFAKDRVERKSVVLMPRFLS